MLKPPLFLIDSYGLIYRSYFAFLTHPLRNNAGRNVSALFGFARTLVGLLDDGAPGADPAGKPLDGPLKPQYLAAVFDSRTPTFRHKMYPEYKATRQKAPEDLHDQVPLVEEFLAGLGVKSLRADGYEADDIIATLAKKCRKEGRQCYVLSSDKDLLQLVGEGTWEIRPRKSSGSGSGDSGNGQAYELVGPAEVKAEWGVEPDRVLDLLSLTGDSSDNVPGVKGIGEKTAVKLMARYGSLDGIYKNIAAIEGAVGRKLAEGKESAYFSRKLISLEYQVPLPVKGIEEFVLDRLNRSAGAEALFRAGVVQVARKLDRNVGGRNAAEGGEKEGEREAAPAKEADSGGGTAGGFSGVSGAPVLAEPSLLGPGTYRTVLDLGELKALLARGKKQRLIALDFETDSLDAWNARP
ncbi:MAG: DNA polymerase I, partial [Treponema sp.]|nr:DNA polymerase I [Treponema sp.]